MIKKKYFYGFVCAILILCNSLSTAAATLPQNGQDYFQWTNQ